MLFNRVHSEVSVALQINPQLAKPAYLPAHTGVLVLIPAALLLNQPSDNVRGKATEDGSST